MKIFASSILFIFIFFIIKPTIILLVDKGFSIVCEDNLNPEKEDIKMETNLVKSIVLLSNNFRNITLNIFFESSFKLKSVSANIFIPPETAIC